MCKSHGRKHEYPNKRKIVPVTTVVCTYCNGHVHGRGDPKYPDCWVEHLHTKVAGLINSGDMPDARG